jgi:hypothetical protein
VRLWSIAFTVMLATWCTPGVADSLPPDFVSDTRQGCGIWNPGGDAHVSIKWSGACQSGLAQGKGVEEWFRDGQALYNYDGEVRDGRWDGHGRVSGPNGKGTEADWRAGKMVRTTVRYANGDQYEGDFQNGAVSGTGTFTWANGTRYAGEFRHGVMDGHGRITFSTGYSIEADWRAGKMDRGKIVWSTGEQYEGDIQNYVPNGIGTMIWKNGDHYVGDFQAGRREGRGTYTYSNGATQEGAWSDNNYVESKGAYSNFMLGVLVIVAAVAVIGCITDWGRSFSLRKETSAPTSSETLRPKDPEPSTAPLDERDKQISHLRDRGKLAVQQRDAAIAERDAWQRRALAAEQREASPISPKYDQLKRFIAKEFHPDHSGASAIEKVVRTETFKVLWAKIDELDRV